jgi:hypothetical protein
VKDRIMAACRKFGIEISDDDSDDSSRSEFMATSGPYYRSFPLEDIHVRSGGDGRTVEAYAAVFGAPAKVKDQDGQYMEEMDPPRSTGPFPTPHRRDRGAAGKSACFTTTA